jgi:CheY-like chemotaxis protein
MDILLVDDNPRVRQGMRTAFESSGFHVSEAEDGAKAVMHVGTHKPDLIVLDLAMPNMNGLQVASILRKLLPAIPIILFTLHASGVLEKEAKAAGVTSVLSKDNMMELLRQVNMLLPQ